MEEIQHTKLALVAQKFKALTIKSGWGFLSCFVSFISFSFFCLCVNEGIICQKAPEKIDEILVLLNFAYLEVFTEVGASVTKLVCFYSTGLL